MGHRTTLVLGSLTYDTPGKLPDDITDAMALTFERTHVIPEGYELFGIGDLVKRSDGVLCVIFGNEPLVLMDPKIVEALHQPMASAITLVDLIDGGAKINEPKLQAVWLGFQKSIRAYTALADERLKSGSILVKASIPRKRGKRDVS